MNAATAMPRALIKEDQSVARGEEIVRLEPWFVYIAPEWRDTVCACCFCALKSSPHVVKMKFCVQCKVLRYCSKECQMSDWSREHKYECSILRQIGAVPSEAAQRAKSIMFTRPDVCTEKGVQIDGFGLIRLVLRRYGRLGVDAHDVSAVVDRLPMLGEAAANADKSELKRIAAWTLSVLRAENLVVPTPDVASVCKLISRLIRNLIPYGAEDEYRPYRNLLYGLFPTLSVNIRHSCDPNAYFLVSHRTLRLVANADLNARSPITVELVLTGYDREKRQRFLCQTFGFECKCRRCTTDRVKDEKSMHSIACPNPACKHFVDGFSLDRYDLLDEFRPQRCSKCQHQVSIDYQRSAANTYFKLMSAPPPACLGKLDTRSRLEVSSGLDAPNNCRLATLEIEARMFAFGAMNILKSFDLIQKTPTVAQQIVDDFDDALPRERRGMLPDVGVGDRQDARRYLEHAAESALRYVELSMQVAIVWLL